MSFRFGFIAHPFKAVYMLSQCGLQIRNKLYHTLFCLRREIFSDIHFAHGLRQETVRNIESTFPTRFDLLFPR